MEKSSSVGRELTLAEIDHVSGAGCLIILGSLIAANFTKYAVVGLALIALASITNSGSGSGSGSGEGGNTGGDKR